MAQKRRMILLLNQARHSLMTQLDAQCKAQLGVSAVQLTALFVLHERNGCQMNELAASLMLDNSAVTGLVKRMQRAGLIEKRRCEEDGRAWRLYITRRGQGLSAKGYGLMQQVNHLMNQGFSESELQTVERYLNQLKTVFKNPT